MVQGNIQDFSYGTPLCVKGNDDLFYSVWQPFLNYLPGDLVDLLLKGRSYFASKSDNAFIFSLFSQYSAHVNLFFLCCVMCGIWAVWFVVIFL